MSTRILFLTLVLLGFQMSESPVQQSRMLRVVHDEQEGRIVIFQAGLPVPVLTQVALPDERPYLHPLLAPDGNGVLTEYRPAHHLHQTGIYWGLKLVNGRDFFMGWQSDYWRRVSASVIEGEGERVRWRVVYDLLDERGAAVLTETHTWAMQEREGKFLLDLEWRGEARQDVAVGRFYVGGLFVRMPWYRGIDGEVVNAWGQRNRDAEGQRAIWADVGMEIEGRADHGHIAIFDHPQNAGFPTAWRVDGELGVGPSRQILGGWDLKQGEIEVARYRLLVYTGALDPGELTRAWTTFATGDYRAPDPNRRE